MARDWTDEMVTIQLIHARMRQVAPKNKAPIPITITQEQDDLGNWVWVVDLHVRIPRVTEYEVTASDPDIAQAVRKAYLGLNNEALIRERANAANKKFGLAY